MTGVPAVRGASALQSASLFILFLLLGPSLHFLMLANMPPFDDKRILQLIALGLVLLGCYLGGKACPVKGKHHLRFRSR
ncbi:MAG: hypothetical protein CTY11_11725 [Methylomonas sp.]|nr:MAG: hypothetical protein CTY11_11725 [Methylomonas sp.]